jgi:hypothetical protein
MCISHLSLWPIFATNCYRDYFHEVKPQFTASGWPEYESEPGYSGSRLTPSVARHFWQDLPVAIRLMGPFSRIARWLRVVIILLLDWILSEPETRVEH